MRLRDEEPCDHRGCLHHITHPCENCGRINGITKEKQADSFSLETLENLVKDVKTQIWIDALKSIMLKKGFDVEKGAFCLLPKRKIAFLNNEELPDWIKIQTLVDNIIFTQLPEKERLFYEAL